MNYIKLTPDNITAQHICCAISGDKDKLKKEWLIQRMKDGLTFYKADVRGKVFIEYIPATHAWYPIIADNYMFINCFWVAGQYKGQGISNDLLAQCILDAKALNMNGIAIISSKKKMPFISDPSYLTYKGFQIADIQEPFHLLYLPFHKDVKIPKFKDCVKDVCLQFSGYTLYYTDQCPHTNVYAKMFKEKMQAAGIPVQIHHIKTAKEARNAPCPFTTYALFHNDRFLTNEILSEKKIDKLISTYENTKN